MKANLSKTFAIQIIELNRSLERLRFNSMICLEGEMKSLEGEIKSLEGDKRSFTVTWSDRIRKSPSLFLPSV